MVAVKNPLDFEMPLVEFENELEALQDALAAGDETKRKEFASLETRVAKLRRETYSKLTSYQRVQLSRHADRPYTHDYISHLVSDFVELHGDRLFRDDPAIIAGIGRLGEQPIVIVGHQRGRTTTERLQRNFAMPQPDGYRKALRLFRMAERFRMPVVTFIDTPGAYPGIEAEERGQAEAIATNLRELANLRTPVVAVVIGEGGSGGALALGVADRILMLANACYSVISPEGCASILWHVDKDEPPAKQAALAADMLRITANDLKELGVIDDIIQEPVGGAHSNHKEAAEYVQAAIVRQIEVLKKIDVDELLEQRYQKFRAMGVFTSQG
jgi:acetyl-CoA carboxylase carboxyl transferase subunit alpha